jgi:hypothetical protein
VHWWWLELESLLLSAAPDKPLTDAARQFGRDVRTASVSKTSSSDVCECKRERERLASGATVLTGEKDGGGVSAEYVKVG